VSDGKNTTNQKAEKKSAKIAEGTEARKEQGVNAMARWAWANLSEEVTI